jgi:hypothetical protein
MKKLLLSSLFLAVVCQISFAQTVSVTTYGVSPFDVVRDSVEQYFDRPYNGLTNVGKETKVFLQGSSTVTLQSPSWTIIQKPTGSNAAFGATKDVDTSTQIITFIPDLTGTYRLTFQSGSSVDTITFNSALYLGVEGGVASCKTCHNNTLFNFVYDKWAATDHATMLERGLNGEASSHYGESCISCHTTGYDPDAANDGFDDFPFVFPTPGPGVYNQMLTQYPDAMKRANIQCESCHGPGSNHLSQMDDSKIVTTIASENCAYCHDDGHYHVFPYQWDVSAHAEGSNFFAGSSRWGCTKCHNGQGFIDQVKGNPQSVTEVIKITCATCHDPHDASLPHQLRKVTATLLDGTDFDGGNGGLCVNCHQGRREAVSYVENYLSSLSSHYGPHYSQQGDMLYGTNSYTWGETLPTSPHYAGTQDACVDCHMAEGDNSGGISLTGGHSFSMSHDGVDNVMACEPCHGNVGAGFDEKKFYVSGNADLDRNGVAEGLQHEIHGLLDQLATLLPPYGETTVGVIDSSWTLNEAAGSFNYKFVYYDHSYGIHNPQYTVALLYLTIGKLGGVVSIDDLDFNTPSSYTLDQNYPNPFNPSTMIRFSLPFESNVTLSVYNINGELITELVNGVRTAGSHEVSFGTSELNIASGIYFYAINASAIDGSKSFQQTKKMVLIK